MAKNNKKDILIFKTFNIKQFISLILGLLFFLTGIALIILYFLEAYAPIYSSMKENLSSALSSFNSGTHTSLGFIGWGIISFLLGAIIIAISLSMASKLEDKEKERKARRELRLKQLKENTEEAVVEDVISSQTEVK